jgi:peptide/nickel transport system permease protein
MITYTFKRLTFVIFTLVGITALTFIFIRIAPGNPASIKIQAAQGLKAEALSADVMDQTLKLYGLKVELPPAYKDFIHRANLWLYGQDPLDHPTTLRAFLEKAGQLGIQYKDWLLGIATLNFGVSYRDHRPVMESIKDALPITLTLNLIEILIVYFISIPLGVFSAVRRQSFMEKSTMVLLLILYSLPNFWVATILLMYLAGGEHLNWFPMVGLWSEGIQNYSLWKQLGNVAWHLVLPVTCMVYGSFAYLTRFSRTTMLEVIKQDYIRTALAKGLPRRKAIWKHAFRNSLIPLITLIGTLLPALLGGSIIIEQIFAIPGMGRLAFQSVLARDYPTIMAITTISAFLTLISLLLSDLAYSWVDPRVTFKAREVR